MQDLDSFLAGGRKMAVATAKARAAAAMAKSQGSDVSAAVEQAVNPAQSSAPVEVAERSSATARAEERTVPRVRTLEERIDEERQKRDEDLRQQQDEERRKQERRQMRQDEKRRRKEQKAKQ